MKTIYLKICRTKKMGAPNYRLSTLFYVRFKAPVSAYTMLARGHYRSTLLLSGNSYSKIVISSILIYIPLFTGTTLMSS